MDNRSLDEFATEPDPGPDTESGSDADTSRSESSDDDGSGGSPVAPETVEPAVTTYAVGEGTCAACGRTVDRRWGGDAGLVCPDCKEW